VIDASDPIMYVSSNGSVVLKNRQCIMTPSYQKGRTINPNVNFAERMYSHTAISGFGQIDLTPVCNGNGGYQIIPDIKLTNRPMQILGQIQSAKIR
jgi:hypothetical protein